MLGTGFYESNDPTNNVKALKEDRVVRIRLQSHQVHPTMLTIIQLCSMKQKCTWFSNVLEANIPIAFSDHRWSGMVYNFGGVCMYVCNSITFESLEVGSSFLHIWYISRGYRSNLYMKVIQSRSRLANKNGPKSLVPRCTTLINNKSGFIKHVVMKFACSMQHAAWGFSAT